MWKDVFISYWNLPKPKNKYGTPLCANGTMKGAYTCSQFFAYAYDYNCPRDKCLSVSSFSKVVLDS